MVEPNEDVGKGASCYEEPMICDYGGLVDITQACFGVGGEDGGAKAGGNPFVNSQPYSFAPSQC